MGDYISVDMTMTVTVFVPEGEDPRHFWYEGESLQEPFSGVDACLMDGDFEIKAARLNGTEERI